mgnify:CR=1 FL=1
MASGDLLFQLPVGTLHPPATSGAAFTAIAGASSPAERFVVAAFDSTTVEYLDSDVLTMPDSYSGGGLTVKVVTGASATAGGTDGYVYGAALRRIADDAEDLDTTAHTYDFNDSAEIQPPSAVGETSVDNITFTSGADMDSVAAGDQFVIRVRRNTGATDDTLGEDTYLHAVVIYET